MIKKFKFTLPFQLLLALFISYCIGDFIPLLAKEGLYAISLTLMEFLVTVLPIMIFSFIFSSVMTMREGAFRFFLILLTAVSASNFISAWIAALVGNLGIAWLPQVNNSVAKAHSIELQPLWSLSIPKLISNQIALLAGLVIGGLSNVLKIKSAAAVAHRMRDFSVKFLRTFFIPFVPLLVFGFAVKFQHEGILAQLFSQYGSVFFLILLVESLYLCIILFLASQLRVSTWLSYLKNLSVPMLTGLSTMSSTMALPMSLQAAEKNTNNPTLARVLIPSTVNFHLVGDGLFIPLLAFAVLHSYGLGIPSIEAYFLFSLYFVLAKFSVAAVPGGGIIVMIPLLEKYLGFSTEMLSLITALYILFDPVITSFNVAGNGAFAIVFSRFYRKTV